MASIRMGRFEVTEGLLPAVCMKCGSEATSHKRKNFSWYPGWINLLILIGLLPWLIVAMILTKRMTVNVPFCEYHKNHWSWRNWFLWSGLGICFLLGVISFAILVANQNRRGPLQTLGGLACVGTALGGVAWLIAAACIFNAAIRPSEITDRSITLTNVSPDFKDAMKEERYYREEERYPRRSSRQRRYQDDDDYEDEWDEGGGDEDDWDRDAIWDRDRRK